MDDNAMKWKTVSTDYLIKDKWLNVRKDVCERPDGKIVDPYYVVENADWVCAVGLTEDDQVVLIRQYRHAIGQVCIEIPGGCVDKEDKDMQHAAARELLEETGYEFTEFHDLGFVSPNPSINTNVMYLFLATGGVKKQEQQLDHNEDIEVMLVPLADLFQMTLDRKLHHAMHVACVMLALYKLGKLKVK